MNPADTRPPVQEIDRHLAARLREARLARAWSQQRLGEALGLTFQQVQKYERAVNRMAASRLWQIALILDLPVGFFYDGLPVTREQEAQRGGAATGTQRSPRLSLQHLRHFETLDPATRAGVFRFVKALAKQEPQP